MVRKSLLLLLIIIMLWMIWAPLGRTLAWKDPDPAIDHREVMVMDSACTRNIVGIQPYMIPEDYMSEGHFYEKLKSYFEDASQSGYFGKNTVVLLPEYLGTWLVVSGEKRSVSETSHIRNAMTLIALSNVSRFVQAWFMKQDEEAAIAATLFRMKAREMARIYTEVFTDLASRYNVTISAGSIVLPAPAVENNRIKVDPFKPLFNTSFVFHPSGEIDQVVIRKSFPITSELPFIEACPIDEFPVFDLPIGKTAILVCADSWYPESYERIRDLGANVILVNSYAAGDSTMSNNWKGYDGSAIPDDVDHWDIGAISEHEAWRRYALPGRIQHTQATVGVNVFLRGRLWDLGSDGQPFFVYEGTLIETGRSDRGGIWNLCF